MRFDIVLNFLLTLLCLFSVGLSSPTPAAGAAGDAAPDALVKRNNTSSLVSLSKPNRLSEISDKEKASCGICPDDPWTCCRQGTFCCTINGWEYCCRWT
ncbi:hypothetical protein FRC12_005261 [Ceratobasidium sp. 428]|nr:hypothetical protein FRC12_005261 [Ceratobasidium sp. 428]